MNVLFKKLYYKLNLEIIMNILNEKNNFKKHFLFLSILFLFSRLFSALIVYKFLESFDTRIFSFTDLKFYNEIDFNIFAPNFVYAYLVKKIGYNSDALFSLKFIIIAFFTSFLVIIPFIILSIKLLKKKDAILFILMLSFHPYLSLYSLKLDSNLFATLGISFYTLWIFYSNNTTLNTSITLNVLSAFFRNAMIPLIWMQFILILFVKRNFSRIRLLIFSTLFILTLFITSSQFFYGIQYISQNYGCYSFENIDKFLQGIFNPNISKFFSFLITPFIHLILNLGAREAISIYCLNLPSEYASDNTLNLIMTFSFLIFHSLLLIKLLIYVFRDFELKKLSIIFPFSILLPTFYGTAHMRYLYPLLPLLIFIQFLPKDRKILGK